MFATFAILGLAGRPAAASVLRFFSPALEWAVRWLPILFVPVVVSQPLPAALAGFNGRQGGAGQGRAAARGVLGTRSHRRSTAGRATRTAKAKRRSSQMYCRPNLAFHAAAKEAAALTEASA
jgi:hypothetical protein